MADRIVVCAGTKKGLFLLESDKNRKKWKTRGPYLKGWQVFHAVIDTRSTPRLHAACNSDTFGANAFSGDIAGKKIQGAKHPPVPPAPNPAIEEMNKKYGIPKTPRVWHIEPGHPTEKKVLYAGTAPAGLFRSEDEGQSWEEVKSLTAHPTREQWNPGAGGQCLHSIQIDPRDRTRMYVGISAAGAFRSDDDGKSWNPINKGIARFPGAPQDTDVGS